MAARSLFHCAASRAIPVPLCYENGHLYSHGKSEDEHGHTTVTCPASDEKIETQGEFVEEDSEITSWLESYEVQDWISCVWGTTQDAMTCQIIVGAALAVWYPSLVKRRLPAVVVHRLVKLVMAMNDKYSAAAAEILAEGMESTWRACLVSEIPHLIGDIFFQVECVSSKSSINAYGQNPVASLSIRDTLVGILLPSLAMADIPGYLHVIESQIWSTASDSPVHVVALMTLIRVVRGCPRNLAPYLDKVVIFILQTMDPGNLTMRRNCLQSSMTALKEVVRVFPMIALNDASTRLAVGDAIGEINNASIRVYDMQSMTKVKVLDASGPPGLPNLLGGTIEKAITTAISALSFSPDGEGLVAFSECGLMIRWWSLGSVWWEKLSRNLVPVQCTKVIFLPPWEGFSPTSTRSSIMATMLHDDERANSPGNNKAASEMDRLKLLIHNLDLSYRLEWVGDRKVKLSQHSNELGTFQL
ncbi:Transducin/WD40 repeat-like superfamily protein [Striga hermonthica]|uniref:Transducin/WD40 repeat-like superfamily protein n=1 Tax=Striga hermonthica TaxID=68872 RepID=A0A9N7MNH8_STRHE|nr:Transducin/WD40 repeat-like superfamily protein [Striga hermonthica]